MLPAPSFSEEPLLILSNACGYHAFLACTGTAFPLLAILTTTACTYPASYALPSSLPVHVLAGSCSSCGPPPPLPRRRERLVQMPFISRGVHPTSYKLVWGLVVEYGPAPDTLPARPIGACRCFPASSLAARCFSPHLSQRSRRLSYLMPMGTMPSSPVLAPVTRHPHDDCLHLSRLTRIYIFLSFISSLGTFILEVVWGTLSLWNMALPLTRSRLGRLVLPMLPS